MCRGLGEEVFALIPLLITARPLSASAAEGCIGVSVPPPVLWAHPELRPLLGSRPHAVVTGQHLASAASPPLSLRKGFWTPLPGGLLGVTRAPPGRAEASAAHGPGRGQGRAGAGGRAPRHRPLADASGHTLFLFQGPGSQWDRAPVSHAVTSPPLCLLCFSPPVLLPAPGVHPKGPTAWKWGVQTKTGIKNVVRYSPCCPRAYRSFHWGALWSIWLL